MCTVSFIPVGQKIFITHNRDEKSARSKAMAPKEYVIKGQKLIFPRDSHAGGTWIALHENGNALVLLNGGFIKHTPTPPYRKSRGLAFLDVAASTDMLETYKSVDLKNIEPFTLIIWNEGILSECRWDGLTRHIAHPDISQPHSWSSVTLYPENVVAKRKKWFNDWLKKNPEPNMQDIIQFHLHGGDGDRQNDLRMNRDGKMLTVSVTAMQITEARGSMKYVDLLDNTISCLDLNFTKEPAHK